MKRIILALDVSSMDEVISIVEKMGDSILWYKVGLQLFLAEGEAVVKYLKSKGKNVFLDLKFFDIPNTVAKATVEAIRIGADFITIHALGNTDMISAARDVIDSKNSSTKILSVTILTSVNEDRLNNDIGLAGSIKENVARLATVAYNAGSHGIVCSPLEIEVVAAINKDLIIVTPGVRLEGDSVDDQKRVMSPKEALSLGSSYLVMGRSLVGKDNASDIVCSIEQY